MLNYFSPTAIKFAAIGLFLAAFFFSVWYGLHKTEQLGEQQAFNAQLQQSLKDSNNEIRKYIAQEKANQQLIKNMMEAKQARRAEIKRSKQNISAVKRENLDVQEYLDTVIPGQLLKQLCSTTDCQNGN